MKIEAYIVCWNEAAILKNVLDYWEDAELDRLIVYDNHSTDLTLELLQLARDRYSYAIEIRTYDSGGTLNDYILRDIKNTCWKGSDADWVFVGDTDEVLYSREPLKHILSCPEYDDVAIVQPCGYQLLAWHRPELQDDTLLHRDRRVRLLQLGPNKTNLFRPDRVSNMHYDLGAHHCNPEHSGTLLYTDDLSWFHLKNLGVQYLLERNAELYGRLPEQVKIEKRIAVHYLPGMDIHNVAAGLADMWKESRPWNEFGKL